MNIYRDSGYIDIRKLLAQNMPFVIIIGGRGTGKTYGGLEYVIEEKIKFLFMRRTQTQIDLIDQPDFSPFKTINRDKGWHIGTERISKANSAFYHQEENDGIWECSGAPIGYTSALSTLANIRGFDASDIPIWIFDEMIAEKHERPIKNEAFAFFNSYETIARNRELQGQKPLQVLAFANSVDIANPIFLELGLVRKAAEMKRKKQEVYINRDRGLLLVVMEESPISERKRNTALYRLTGQNSRFARMSLDNDFSGDDMGRISSRPIAEYRPIVSYGEITIYEHKHRREYYVSTHRAGSPQIFSTSDTDRARFRRQFLWVWEEYMENNIEFEEYLCEIILQKIFT